MGKTEENIALIIDRYNTSKEFNKPQREEWDKNAKDYAMIPEELTAEEEERQKSNLVIPLAFTLVETVLPNMIEAVFAENPPVKVITKIPELLENAKGRERVFTVQLEEMDAFMKLLKFFRMVCKYGTAYLKLGWEYREALKQYKVKTREIMGISIGRSRVKKNVALYDNPNIYPISPYYIYKDPMASSIKEALYVIQEDFLTLRQLQDREKMGWYNNISKLGEPQTLQEDIMQNVYSELETNVPSAYQAKGAKRYRILEHWEPDRVMTLCENKIIGDHANQYDHQEIPYFEGVICPTDTSPYGIGVVKMVQALQAQLNETTNRRMDNVKIVLDKIFVVARDARINIDTLYTKPGKVILASYVNGIKELETKDITAAAYTEIAMIQSWAEKTTGIHQYSAGEAPEHGREAATTVLALQNVANKRFKTMIITCLRSSFMPLMAQMAELNRQFLSPQKCLAYGGNADLFSIDPDQETEFSYIPMGAAIEGISKYARQQTMNQVFFPMLQAVVPTGQVDAQGNQVMTPIIDVNKWTIEYLESLGFSDAMELAAPTAPKQLSPPTMGAGGTPPGGMTPTANMPPEDLSRLMGGTAGTVETEAGAGAPAEKIPPTGG